MSDETLEREVGTICGERDLRGSPLDRETRSGFGPTGQPPSS